MRQDNTSITQLLQYGPLWPGERGAWGRMGRATVFVGSQRATHLHHKQLGVGSPAGGGVVGVTGAGNEVARGGGGGGGEDEGVVDAAPGTHCQ